MAFPILLFTSQSRSKTRRSATALGGLPGTHRQHVSWDFPLPLGWAHVGDESSMVLSAVFIRWRRVNTIDVSLPFGPAYRVAIHPTSSTKGTQNRRE